MQHVNLCNEAMYKSETQKQVETVVKGFGRTVYEWLNDTSFVDTHGFDGEVFDTYEDAEASVLSGDNHQNALDFVSGAMSDEDWINFLKASGVPEENAEEIVNQERWEEVVKIIVAQNGPSWFLSTYSGTYTLLENGKLLYY